MNREEAKALLPVIEAFIDDRPIQSRYRNKIGAVWLDFGSGEYPSFHNSELEWRVKPEKTVCWLNFLAKGIGASHPDECYEPVRAYSSEDAAKNHAKRTREMYWAVAVRVEYEVNIQQRVGRNDQ